MITDVLQVVLLIFSGIAATMVVMTRRQPRQVITLSVYGLVLALLFFVFQAPDVTLSELTVGAVVLPIALLLTLAKVGKHAE